MDYFDPNHQGPIDGVEMGDPNPMDGWTGNGQGNNNNYNNSNGGQGKQKNNNSKDPNKKKKNDNNQNDNDRYRQPVQSRYEGFTIEKAEPLQGDKATWSRVGSKPMKIDQTELVKIVRNGNLGKHWVRLNKTQRDILDRLVEQKIIDDPDKNATWKIIGVDTTCVGGGLFSSERPKVTQIRVILKRQDTDPSQWRRSKSVGNYKPFLPNEIIDLNKSLKPSKNNKQGKGGKSKGQNNDLFNIWNDNGHQGGDHNNNIFNPPPPPPPPGMQYMPPPPPPPPPPPLFDNNYQQQMPMQDHFNNPMGQGGLFPPFAPMPPPLDNQFPQQMQPNFQRYGGNHQQPPFQHPFQPEPHIPFQPNLDHHAVFDSEDFNPRERSRSRLAAAHHTRRRSSTHNNKHRNSRDYDRLHNEVGILTDKISRWGIYGTSPGGSSDDTHSDPDSIFSHDDRRHRHHNDYSPPSSPRSAVSAPRRGSLDRRHSTPYHPPREHLPTRSKHYRDSALVVPERPGRRRRDSAPLHHHSSRPRLQHSRAVDDYPPGRAYHALPRRAIELDERYDYQREGRGGGAAGYDSLDEGYGGTRGYYNERDRDRDRRRRSGGRGYFY